MEKKISTRLAGFGIDQFEQMQGRDGVIFQADLTYEGKRIITLYNEGNGGPTWLHDNRITPQILQKMCAFLQTVNQTAGECLGVKNTLLCYLYMKNNQKFANVCEKTIELSQGLMELIIEFDDCIKFGKKSNSAMLKDNDIITILNCSNNSLLSEVETYNTYADDYITVSALPTLLKAGNINKIPELQKKRLKVNWAIPYKKGKRVYDYSANDVFTGIEIASEINKANRL